MEVDVILELCVEYFDKKGVSIAYIVSDDDTTMRSNLKHSLREKIDAGYMYLEDWPRTNSGRKKIATVDSQYVFPNLYFLQIRRIEKKNTWKKFVCSCVTAIFKKSCDERTCTETHDLVRIYAVPD